MSYWINERCYKTLENALVAYEEYKKNERILNGEGLADIPSQIDTRISYYTGFGSPDISDAPIGTIYVDIANYGDHTSTAAKDNKKIINCRNCGAPIKSRVCEYCGSHY